MSQTLTSGNFVKNVFSRIDLSSIKLPLTLSFINQMVSSGGNFFLGVYLARTLTLENFGLYGVGFGICMLYVGVGNAVILTQMAVNMPDKASDEKETYAARMLCAVLILGAAVLTLAMAGISLAIFINPAAIDWLPSVSAIAVASALFLCNEFFISYAYVKRKESMALTVNALTMFVLFTGLALEHISGANLKAENVLLLYALGATAGTLTAYAFSPLSLRKGMRNLVPDFIESWRHGRWALGGVLVTWIQIQTYTYVLAFFLGPAGVGLANAAKIFISPFAFLFAAINKIAIPRLADLRESNREGMLRASAMITAGLSILTILYSAILLSSLDFVTQLVLGRHDEGIKSLVWVWCLVLVFQMIRSGGSVLLQVQRKFRVLTLMNIPSAVITLIAAILLIQWLGAVGAIWGMVAGEIALSLLIWREIRHDKINGN